MEAAFWQHRWQVNQIGFHLPSANPLLTNNFSHLNIATGSRVFVPMCGKTIDIHWLLAKGYYVVGVELVEDAIIQLFDELDITPTVTEHSEMRLYQGPNIDIWVGDIFQLPIAEIGRIAAVYDRAALVALPVDMRLDYVSLITKVCSDYQCPQLLVTFEYDQRLAGGPPFSISQTDVAQYYDNRFSIALLQTADVEGGMKGKCPAQECVFALMPL